MFDRISTPLDLASIPIPSGGLIGFVGYTTEETCYPVYRVRQEDWDELRRIGERQRSERIMSTLKVIERELIELQRKADEMVRDQYTFTSEMRAQAFDVSGKIGDAIKACKAPTTEKAAF
jgi:hypothetical protein